MALFDTIGVITRGAVLRANGTIVANAQGIEGIGGGSAAQIDITNLTSGSREYLAGYPEEGSVSVSGVLTPHDTSTEVLNSLKATGATANWEVVYGGDIDADTDRCTGDGRVSDTGLAFTAAPVANADITNAYDITTTASVADLPPIVPGNYVRIAGDDYKVVKVVAAANKGVITFSSASDITGETEREFSVVQPAYKIQWRGQVLSFSTSLTANESVQYSLTASISGAVSQVVGTPDLT